MNHMKMFSLLTMLLSLTCAVGLMADDQQQQLTPEEAQELMMQLSMPGEEHARFADLVGQWDCEIRMFIPGVEEPQISEGSAEFELILDGRFLVQGFEGSFAGSPFSGHGMSGYDRIQEKYIGTWMDSYGTGMMQLEGTYDEETGVMTEIGTSATLGGELTMKNVTEFQDDDEFLLTIYTVEADGTDTKLMEITYTRAEGEDR